MRDGKYIVNFAHFKLYIRTNQVHCRTSGQYAAPVISPGRPKNARAQAS